mgnify:CR=1 FL=1
MLLMQHVSHLVSSRQMPYMGIQTEIKARDKFREVLESDFTPDPKLCRELGMAARRIGSICRKIRKGPIPYGSAYVSVTSSGEYRHSITKGAQAAAVKEAMERILTIVSDKDEVEDTPFGPAVKKKGRPLWKTVFRTEPVSLEDWTAHYREWNAKLFESYFLIKEQPGRFHGLNKDTGRQLMYVDWKESSKVPVLRAEVVPEMGNKARHVTIGPYWLNVLQAPLAHVLVDAVKYHPSVFSSFHRQDQAFEAVKGLCRIKKRQLTKSEAILSSDLKDATNAQQWKVTKMILQGFIDGYGLSVTPEYVNLVLDLIGPRLVEFKDGISVYSKTGIMMGEPMAKPSLTLLNLSIEELSFLEFTNSKDLLYTGDPSPFRNWRYIHIGGDDHLVRGPVDYLRRITDNHLAAGSHIDPGKHGFSKICVKYTERLLNLTNLEYGKPFDSEDYSQSTIVDSVKVRLLEKGQSTLMKKDNKNVAIGKSQQLGGCIEWLPIDSRFYTESKKESIRSLFIERMGALLPRKAVNPRAFAAIHLPQSVGGYGLGMKRELSKFLYQCPEPTIGLIHKAHAGVNVKKDLRYFRTLNTNTSVRGVEDILELQTRIIDQLNDYPNMINAISWWDVKQQFPAPDGNARRTIALAADAGILSVEEFAKRATRGNLFQELLMGKKGLKIFNTRKFIHTYRWVWGQAEDSGLLDWVEHEPLDNAAVAKAIDSISPQWYFDINQVTTMDLGFWDPEHPEEEVWDFHDATYIDKYTKGLPSFNVGFKVLGLKH